MPVAVQSLQHSGGRCCGLYLLFTQALKDLRALTLARRFRNGARESVFWDKRYPITIWFSGHNSVCSGGIDGMVFQSTAVE